MSLLIWCRRIPLYFHLLLLSLHCGYPSHATCHCDIPCNTCEPALSLTLHHPTLIGPITNCTIGPASCIECTCDLWTPLMSLLIRYRCIPLYFRLCITFPPSRIPSHAMCLYNRPRDTREPSRSLARPARPR